MAFEKMNLTPEEVRDFQTEHARQDISDVELLSGGEWSQAFGFKQAGRDFVIRFGQHGEDFLKDQLATRFSSENLPIPKVIEVGKAFDGYFVVSERAFGTMIDDLDKPAMKRVIPSLFTTLDVMRTVDVSKTTGYGMWDSNGKAPFPSWSEYLLSVNDDTPDRKIHGWKAGLQKSPLGDKPFNEAYARLVGLTKDLPEVRSLIHNDLMHFNVLVNDDKITAVFDWANALYGDFLYDLAMFTFWGPIHEPVKGIDWEAEARAHYEKIGLEVPEFERRLQCCMIHMGLDHLVPLQP